MSSGAMGAACCALFFIATFDVTAIIYVLGFLCHPVSKFGGYFSPILGDILARFRGDFSLFDMVSIVH